MFDLQELLAEGTSAQLAQVGQLLEKGLAAEVQP
jgi:hypothetical protein